MIDREPSAGGRAGTGATFPEDVPERYRERVTTRRRRSSRNARAREWTARSSRRRYLRTIAVCTGVLLLMAVGLYFGLDHQDHAPAEGASHARRMVLLSAA